MKKESSDRVLALDYLRGFFIVVIIVDHLWRWPNLLSVFTGEGRLWVSAAEGFVIISGLLVGYIRGRKNRDQPLATVSKKLFRRALLLYAWFIGMTLIYTACTWYIPAVSAQPWIEIPKGNWYELITLTLQTKNAHIWIHFLYLYAIFLALTPIAIWLFRRRAAYVVALLSFIGSIIGVRYNIEWMEWLPLFFLPAIAGHYLPTIQQWWHHQAPRIRRRQLATLYGFTACVLIVSSVFIFLIPDQPVAMLFNALFDKEFSFNGLRITLALICFVAFALAFNHILPWLERWTSWLLLPFGRRSLTAYIIHGAIICLIGFAFVDSTNIAYNTALGVTAVIATLVLLRIPLIARIIPR